MSKSLGNFFTVRDLLNDGVPGEVIRFVMLSTHYRKPMDWTEKKRVEAVVTLEKWRALTEFVVPTTPSKKVLAALNDDLNTSLILSELDLIADRKDAGVLKASANLLGLLEDDLGEWSWKRRPIKDFKDIPEWHPARVWIAEITKPLTNAISSNFGALKAMQGTKIPKFNFNLKLPKIQIVDPKLLAGFKRLGEYANRLEVEYPEEMKLLQNVPFSLLTIDIMNAIHEAEIARMVDDRNEAKAKKEFEAADRIRKQLEAVGLLVIDTADGQELDFGPNFDPAKLEALK